MAGFHEIALSPCGDVARNTEAMIKAISNPLIDAIAHPGNPVYQVDMPAVVNAAREYGKLLEINNNSAAVRPGSIKNCQQIAFMCKGMGIPVICGSDAHVSFDVGSFSSVIEILKSVDFPKELVLNTSPSKTLKFLEGIRKRNPKQ
jgi:putative hydrolase